MGGGRAKCERCGCTKVLTGHHVTKKELIFVCRPCHDRIHGMNPPKMKKKPSIKRRIKRPMGGE